MSEKAGYDVVVVGGGAAGCVVAARLAEDGTRRVLLLEAGPDHRALMPADVRDGWRPTTRHDWGYVSEPDAGGVARPLPRGKLLGGCSSTNATFALRGHPADYDAWEQAGNDGWSFDEVLPFSSGWRMTRTSGRQRATAMEAHCRSGGTATMSSPTWPRPA